MEPIISQKAVHYSSYQKRIEKSSLNFDHFHKRKKKFDKEESQRKWRNILKVFFSSFLILRQSV